MHGFAPHEGDDVESERLTTERLDSLEMLKRTAKTRRSLFSKAAGVSGLKKGSLKVYLERQDQILSFVGTVMQSEDTSSSSSGIASDSATVAVTVSFFSNVGLFLMKVVAFALSGSMALLASLLDSGLDILSGVVLWLCRRTASLEMPFEYPIGRSRMEPLGVVIFATIMSVSSLQIIIETCRVFYDGIENGAPDLGFGPVVQGIAVFVIVLKAALHVYCRAVFRATNSVSVESYADDHRNDVFTNGVSIGCLAVAIYVPTLWWLDCVGALIVALYIIGSWTQTAAEQINKLVGRSADSVLLSNVTYLAADFHPLIKAVDTVRGYYLGERCMLEVHIVLDESTPLKVSHDIGEALEMRIEELPEVGRCFVHNDYEFDHRPEHRNTKL